LCGVVRGGVEWLWCTSSNKKGISPAFVEEYYKYFKTAQMWSAEDALKAIVKFSATKYGAIPMYYTKVMYPFFRTEVGQSPTDALNSCHRYYEFQESSGMAASNEELINDIPAFYKFFRGTCYFSPADSLKQVERVLKGSGRCNLNQFKDTYSKARSAFKTPPESLDMAFKEQHC
jgi:hypothetical protein